jgi:hypothetical protein
MAFGTYTLASRWVHFSDKPYFRCCGGYMKVEFGFQSNCSELVSHLGILDRDEIIEAMGTISRVTGWVWGIRAYDDPDILVIPISVDRLPELLSPLDAGKIDSRSGLLVNLEKLVSISSGKLKEPQVQLLKKIATDDQWLPLELYDGSEDGTQNDWPGFSMNFYLGCGCGKKGLTLSLESHSAEELPQFQLITREFGSDISGEDCCYDYTYEEWLTVHFLPGESQKLIGDLYKKPKEVERTISYLKEHPPIVESRELTDIETEAISEFRDCVNVAITYREKEKRKRGSRWRFLRRK